MPADEKKNQLTFRITAVIFVLSAVLEVFSISSETLLFGEIRGGAVAGIYHIMYVALFTALGYGLWSRERWGYSLSFVTTVICTLDDAQLLLSRQALETFFANQLGGYESILQSLGIDLALIMQAIVLVNVVIILSWWSFAYFVYRRRDYFKK
ncbi:MAG: hypothetical protein ACYC9L_00635 [Sulfuricaulis sp.]